MRNTRILSCLRAHTHTHNLLISLASLLIATLGRNEKGFQLIILLKIDSFAFIPSSFPLLPLGPLQHSITLAPPVSCDSITLMNLFFWWQCLCSVDDLYWLLDRCVSIYVLIPLVFSPLPPGIFPPLCLSYSISVCVCVWVWLWHLYI